MLFAAATATNSQSAAWHLDRNLLSAAVNYLSEVFLPVVAATNAVSERSASALRRLKTYLRTTMSQERLNLCMILHVYKKMTGKLNMADIENQFVSAGADPHRFPLFYRNRSDFSL